MKKILSKVTNDKKIITNNKVYIENEIEGMYYKVDKSEKCVILVAGCGGGWSSPNGGEFYPTLANKLFQKDISALHIKYRDGGNLEKCTYDLLQAINYVNKDGITSVGLVGWSFGGAVVCQAAGKDKNKIVKTVVTLATQSLGVDPISKAENVAKLFIHGNRDTCLSTKCSEYVYKLSSEPKKLKIVNDHHGFSFTHKEVGDEIVDLFENYLKIPSI